MAYKPDIHHRHSIRLAGYDYASAGLYFITICTHDRGHVFGEIVRGNGAGDVRADDVRAGDVRAGDVRAGDVRAGSEPAPTVSHGAMKLNRFGAMVEFTWFDLLNHIGNIELHEFVVMPNHVHGIIQIIPLASVSCQRDRFTSAPLRKPGKSQALPEIVRQFKTFSAKRINASRGTKGASVWQRNYYEHIIRDEDSYLKIAEYILNNPLNWQQDSLYGQNH